MKKLLTIALAAALTVPAAAYAKDKATAPLPAADVQGSIPGLVNPPLPAPDTVVAVVNGGKITQADVNLFLQQVMGGNGNINYSSSEQRRQALEMAENTYLLAQAGKQLGAAKNEAVQAELRLAQQQVLSRFAIAQYLAQQPITEDAIKKFYNDTIVPNLKANKEYEVRHVLVKTEADAKDLLAQLQANKISWKDAAQKSEDTGTKANGGELGFQPLSNFVPDFAKAVEGAPVGKILPTVVHTQFGYHVIEVEAVRPGTVPELKNVEGQVRQILAGQAVEKFVKQLRGKSKITLSDDKAAKPAKPSKKK